MCCLLQQQKQTAMITNFEEITAEFTADEKKLIPVLIKGFNSHSKADPVKAPVIISKLKAAGYKISQPRLRKIVNFLRAASIIPVIATSNGYFVSNDPQEISKQIQSLHERADAIKNSAKGLEQFITNSHLPPQN